MTLREILDQLYKIRRALDNMDLSRAEVMLDMFPTKPKVTDVIEVLEYKEDNS